MFAVVKAGGQQYKVAKDDVIKIDKIEGEEGSEIILENVLLVSDDKKGLTVGAPLVKGATVTVTILEQTRDKKVLIFKKRRRKNSRRKNGHRQYITILKVTNIQAA
jgi:large subunit ribosomal protein L21